MSSPFSFKLRWGASGGGVALTTYIASVFIPTDIVRSQQSLLSCPDIISLLASQWDLTLASFASLSFGISGVSSSALALRMCHFRPISAAPGRILNYTRLRRILSCNNDPTLPHSSVASRCVVAGASRPAARRPPLPENHRSAGQAWHQTTRGITAHFLSIG